MNTNQTSGESLIMLKTNITQLISSREKLTKSYDQLWKNIKDKDMIFELLLICFDEELLKVTPGIKPDIDFIIATITSKENETRLYNYLHLLLNAGKTNPTTTPKNVIKAWNVIFKNNSSICSKEGFQSIYNNLNTCIMDIEKHLSKQCPALLGVETNNLSNNNKYLLTTASTIVFPNANGKNSGNDSISVSQVLKNPISIVNKDNTPNGINFERNNKKFMTMTTNSQAMQLLSPKYEHQDIDGNINIVYKTKDSFKEIAMDTFLQKIALEGGSRQFDQLLIHNFIEQSIAFITVDIFVKKIISAFMFFYTAYQEKSWDINEIPENLIRLLNEIARYYIENKYDLSNDVITEITNFNRYLLDIPALSQEIKKEINDVENSLSKIIKNPIRNLVIPDKLYVNVGKTKPIEQFNIFKLTPLIFALRITEKTNLLYRQMSPREGIPSISDKKNKCPNLFKIITFANNLSFFIIEDIGAYDHKPIRARVIEKYILVAECLFKLHNSNDGLTIISAGSNTIVQFNIAKSWGLVTKAYKEKYQRLKSFLTFEDSYKNIRNDIETCIKNNIKFTPYIGILLKRGTFFEEKVKYVRNNLGINIDKINIVAGIINEFQKWKGFISNDKVLGSEENKERLMILDMGNPKKERELIMLSKLIEPVFMLYDKKKPEKRKTQSECYLIDEGEKERNKQKSEKMEGKSREENVNKVFNFAE